MSAIKYNWLPEGLVTAHHMQEIATLYSNHYGIWSKNAPNKAGEKVRLSHTMIARWFSSKNSMVAMARHGDELVGYAIAIKKKEKGWGIISWVTQLVVHENFRNQGVGKRLLFSIWTFSDHYAWGVLSSSPYAIRALEKATHRRCDPVRIKKNYKKLLRIGAENVSYVSINNPIEVTETGSRINTEFYADHSTLDERVSKVSSSETPWTLGELEEGWEWFAFTFNDQAKLQLTTQEIKEMLEASDDVTNDAYSRMSMASSHAWAKHFDLESEHIIKECNLAPKSSVLDIGCGAGRHSISLAKRGMTVTGVDYVKSFIDRAIEKSKNKGMPNDPVFITNDCRTIRLESEFDCVLCLYDVIGTYAEEADNLSLLQTVAVHLKRGGKALLSVMNYELTHSQAKNFFSLSKNPSSLLNLPASNIMETTGNIFNPEFYLIDEESGIVYRKEQFKEGYSLPSELIVRDKRFSKKEIESLCGKAGLNVIWSRFVKAGDWTTPLEPTNPSAKEILVFCEKSAN